MSFRHDSEDSNCSSAKSKKDLNLLADSNFLSNFNPENSKREQAKMKRQSYNKTVSKPKSSIDRTSMYDEFGLIRQTQEDLCDCFDFSCVGCHFPCESCGSQKCSIKCRVNRKFSYETIEHDGKGIMLKNPLISIISYRTNSFPQTT